MYCIAHAINKGWIDASAFGPAALLGWNAVSTKINAQGQIEGTCGTGMAFDPASLPLSSVSPYAAHGYGPRSWQVPGIINLLEKQHPKMNDNAIQFYSTEQTTAPRY